MDQLSTNAVQALLRSTAGLMMKRQFGELSSASQPDKSIVRGRPPLQAGPPFLRESMNASLHCRKDQRN